MNIQNKRIIIENAYESWRLTIRCCDEIIDGNISLSNKKLFVMSLHNSIELFFKQIMIDNNDYRVIQIKNINSDGEPYKTYLQSTDLNKYFKENSENYKSIEFSSIIEIHRKLIPSYFTGNISFKKQLERINKLRNKETHFGIEYKEFLTDEDFMYLYNFMIDFYDMLKNHTHIFPYFGKPYGDYQKMDFTRQKLKTFSYVGALKNSKYLLKILPYINRSEYWGTQFEDVFSITDCIYETVEGIKDITSFDELYEYIKILNDNNFIDFDYGQMEEIQDDYGQVHEEPISYVMSVKF